MCCLCNTQSDARLCVGIFEWGLFSQLVVCQFQTDGCIVYNVYTKKKTVCHTQSFGAFSQKQQIMCACACVCAVLVYQCANDVLLLSDTIGLVL